MINNFIKSKNDHKGQVLPILAIAILVMVIMAAVLLDGGVLMLNRRRAQAAADAGALAGARLICLEKTQDEIETAAWNYAVTENGADPSSTASYDSSTGKVTVAAEITQGSWFARILGNSTNATGASATAGCLNVASSKTLPIAWSCRKPVGVSDSPNCQVFMLDWETEMKPLITGSPNPVTIEHVGEVSTPFDFSKNILDKHLYVIMDSAKTKDDVEYSCIDTTLDEDGDGVVDDQPGKIDCDINDDGYDDVLAGGGRSWLDLDGGHDLDENWNNGADALKDWIKGINVPTLRTHTWLGGQTGVATSIFKTVETEVKGKVVLLPVFDGICDTNPDDKPKCIEDVHKLEGIHPYDDYPVKESPGADYYFHIIGFSAFYVTCVDDGGNNNCPGANQLIKDNEDAGIWKNVKIKSIEGYFIENYPFESGEGSAGGYDLGVHIISLSP